MRWAIDVGNTHTVVGLHDGAWNAVWRLATHSGETEDQIAATLSQLCAASGLAFEGEALIIGSVVPSVNEAWRHLAKKWLGLDARFLENGEQVGLEVTYDPPHAVGADRIANAIAGLDRYGAPLVVVDFGTATTFDTLDADGRYVGGAIMPGVLVSVEALASRAAKLPQVSLEAPSVAIGRNTVDALRSGVMYGYAGAVDSVVERIASELGDGVTVIATGGLARSFEMLSKRIQHLEPNLTLDGLVLALDRLAI